MAFTAFTRGAEVLLRWTTASETNNVGFAAEQQPAHVWREVGYVAGRGTTSERHDYAYPVAVQAAGTFRFRLRQIDFDGTSTYTSEVLATVEPENALTLTMQGTDLHLTVGAAQAVRVSVYDALGRRVALLLNDVIPANTDRSWSLSGTLAAGVYVVQATSATASASRVVVLR